MLKKQGEGIRVRRSPEFKLKDDPRRNLQVLHLKDFGFVPETIIIERVRGNWFTVNAVLTENELKKEKRNQKEDDNNKNAA